MYTHAKALERAKKQFDLIEAGWTPGAKTVMGGFAPVWGRDNFRMEFDTLRKAYVCWHDPASGPSSPLREQSATCREWRDAIESLKTRIAIRCKDLQDIVNAIEFIQER